MDLMVAQQKSAGTFGFIGSELERSADPSFDVAVQQLDMRVLLPLATSQEASRIAQMGILKGMASGQGTITSREYNDLLPFEKAGWKRLSVRREEIESMTHAERDGLELGQVIMGERMRELEESMHKPDATPEERKGRAPFTVQKQSYIDALSDAYVPLTTIKEMEIFWTLQDPSYAGPGLIRDLTTLWKLQHTVLSPRHQVKNLWSSVVSNGALGVVPVGDFVSSVTVGRGAYADSLRGLKAWEPYALGTGDFAGKGSRNRAALRGHPDEAQILLIDRIVEAAGGSTMRANVLSDMSLSAYADAILTPTGPGRGSSADQMMASPWMMMDRTMGLQSDLHVRVSRLMGSPNPHEQAEGVHKALSIYGFNEIWLKTSGVLSLMRKNPSADFESVLDMAFRGTAHYAERNPYVYALSSMIHPGASSRVQEQARAIITGERRARGKGPKMSAATENWAKTAFQHPFLLYGHTIGPAWAETAAYAPWRGIAHFAMTSTFFRLATTAAALSAQYDQDNLYEAQAGSSGFGSEPINSEAIDIFVDRYALLPLAGIAGVDATGTMQGTLRLAGDEWKESMRAMMKSSRRYAVGYAGRRGAETQQVDGGELFRPASFVPDSISFLKHVASNKAPAFEYSRDAFLNQFLGTVAVTSAAGMINGAQVMRGEQGKSFWESLGGAAEKFQGEFFSTLHPATSAYSKDSVRLLEEGPLQGQTWRDALIGVVDPSKEKQPVGQRMLMAAVSAVLPVTPVRATPKTQMYKGGALERLRIEGMGLLDIRSAPSRSETDESSRKLGLRLDRQLTYIARDAYYESAYGNGMGLGLDVMMANSLDLKADVDDKGRLVSNPTTAIGRFAKAQVARGQDEAFVLDKTMATLAKVMTGEQYEILVDAARRVRMDPNVFARLWNAADKGNEGLLEQMKIDLIQREDFSHLGEYQQMFWPIWRTESGEAQGNKLRLMRELYTEVFQDQPMAQGSMQPASRALGGQAFDVAPERAVTERPYAPKKRRPLLEGILPEGNR